MVIFKKEGREKKNQKKNGGEFPSPEDFRRS